MSGARRILLNSINHIGRRIPKSLQRRIADFPGVLGFFEKLSHSGLEEVRTPEGFALVINPLFHANLVGSGDLRGYEPQIREALSRYTKPGMVAYDIGANVGVFSFLFASLVGDEGTVYAFEPEENNYRCLEKSLEKYSDTNIVLDTRAVGKARSSERFDRRGGAFSGRLVDGGDYATTENIRVVETVSIDHAATAEGYRIPDILKIDVEGNEGIVLEGMKGILERHNPIIICELHTHLGEKANRVTNLLSGFGYTISYIDDAPANDNAGATAAKAVNEKHIVAIKNAGP